DVSIQPKKKCHGESIPDPVWGYFFVGEHTGECHYELWRNNVAEEEKTVKQKHKIENNIKPNIEVITEEKQREIDCSILKVW
ncbi:1070_t:CDS:2, partial [Dentiscutata erythropus]